MNKLLFKGNTSWKDNIIYLSLRGLHKVILTHKYWQIFLIFNDFMN